MSSVVSALICFLNIASSGQTPPRAASVMDALKPFEGRWQGDLAMGATKLHVDMTWAPFGGRWSEVRYTYTGPQMKLEARVLLTSNAVNSGFNVWMFANDLPVPDQMKAVMKGKELVVLPNRPNTPEVKFWIDDPKTLQMRIAMPGEKPTELGKATLKPAKS